jgi:choline dehydrogenase-like flavoprotein
MLADVGRTPDDHYDACVVGGGPGGILAATLMAERGLKVVIIERGQYTPQKDTKPFSASELRDRYKNAGITAMLGAPSINYVEGSCLGGGSEVNSGLYHRPSPGILDQWVNSHHIEDLNFTELEPLMALNEEELGVSYLPGPASRPSLKLAEGAEALGWQALEVPRWFAYDHDQYTPQAPKGVRRSATEVYLSRFLAAGGHVVLGAKAERLRLSPEGIWCCEVQLAGRAKVVRCDYLHLAAGAIDTPFLLLKSQLGSHIGQSLAIHPTIKIMAQFAEPVNGPAVGVPVHQVKEFAPDYSFGCAISSLPFLLAQAMSRDDLPLAEVANHWQQFFTYYAMTSGGRGRVRQLPFFKDPVVQYRLSEADLRLLATATRNLSRLLLAAGATQLHISDKSIAKITGPADLIHIPNALSRRTAELMTIHVMGSCPMGENRPLCATNSWGRLHGLERVYIADTSLFPSALGANPQGCLMALVRRNTQHFLSEI